MPVFLALRHLPGLTQDRYAAAQRAAADVADQVSAAGRPVRYLRGFFLPATGRAVCVFDAACSDNVRAVNEAAGVPCTEVVEAIEVLPSGSPRALADGQRWRMTRNEAER